MNDATIDGQIARREGALIAYLEPELVRRNAILDHAQAAALDRLQQLADELEEFRAARQSTLRRLFTTPGVPRGVYLWGGVGRGKTFLMDSFFASVPLRRKTRVHFHAFMRDVHGELKKLKREEDPLVRVAEHIGRRWRLVCFDEFHVADIADAMILGRLLARLVDLGVVMVVTSNYPPEGLYPDGLQRENFLPSIALLQQWLDIVHVDGGVDYRLRTLERAESFHVPGGPQADAALAQAFEAMRSGPDENPRLEIEGRTLTATRRAGSTIWFTFASLCDGPRSQRDYLELARRFAVMIVSDIPVMSPQQGDVARRFTWLIDILYEHRVKMLASAAALPEALYRSGPNVHDFARTVSRLAEMRTREYMARPHESGEAAAG